MVEFELRMEIFRVVEWRDGMIYKTESKGVDWVDESTVNNNKPAVTQLVYAPATGYWATKTNIRVKREVA